jgi:hypothetical protein
MNHPRLLIQFRLPVLLARVAHGTRHMSPIDLTFRAVLLVLCLVVAAWMIHRGALVWPLVVGVVGSLSLALDAVELYAAGALCDDLAEQEEDR